MANLLAQMWVSLSYKHLRVVGHAAMLLVASHGVHAANKIMHCSTNLVERNNR